MRSFSNLSRLCLVVVLTLGTATAAPAAVLVTPALTPGSSDFLICEIINVSTKAREVTIQVLNGSGGSLGAATVTVQPGALTASSRSGGMVPGAGYYKFTVPGSKSSYRAYAKLFSGFVEYVVAPAE